MRLYLGCLTAWAMAAGCADGKADGSAEDGVSATVDADGDGYGDDVDCGASSTAIHPGAPEVCDGIDNDCDGAVDEDATDAQIWYPDSDGDHYGAPEAPIVACDAPAGSVTLADDCNDKRVDVYPGAVEVCDAEDQDCDGLIDDDASDATTWYADVDADGFGDPASPTVACTAPAANVTVADDCDDARADIYLGAADVAYDGVDQDCDGGDLDDMDGDGVASWVVGGADCDDGDDTRWPGSVEVPEDGVDNDCDGMPDPVGETWHIAGEDVDLITVAVTGTIEIPGAASVDAGTGGTAELDGDGAFVVRMNSQATGMLRVLDADGNVIGLSIVAKGAGLVAPSNLTLDSRQTIRSLFLLTPGLAAADPYVTIVLRATLDTVVDDEALASAAADLDNALLDDPDAIWNPPESVNQLLETWTSAVMDRVTSAGRRPFGGPASRTYDSPSAFNYVSAEDNGVTPLADAWFAELAPMDFAGSIEVQNTGFRWLSVYIDEDDTRTAVTSDDHSRWLGVVPSRSISIPGSAGIATALLSGAADALYAYFIDPNDPSVLETLGNSLSSEVAAVADLQAATFSFPEGEASLEPYRTGRLLLAGEGAGVGAEPGNRHVVPTFLDVTTNFVMPVVRIAADITRTNLDFDAGVDAPTRAAQCQDLAFESDIYLALVEQIGQAAWNRDWESFVPDLQSLFAQVLTDEAFLTCVGIEDVATAETIKRLLSGTASGRGLGAMLVAIDIAADALSGISTLAAWLTTISATPPGASFDVRILDQDEDHDAHYAYSVGNDCADDNPLRSSRLVEECDGIDNDCDEVIDDGVTSWGYVDGDTDGHGAGTGSDLGTCVVAVGYSAVGDDCDDGRIDIYPGAQELPDGDDNDCDGVPDEGTTSGDDDGDFWSEADGDCDDTRITAFPGAEEEANGLDDDCDGREDNLGIWYGETIDATGAAGRFPRIAIDGSDEVHVFWVNGSAAVTQATRGAFGWSATTLSSSASTDYVDMDACVGDDGVEHVFWSDVNVNLYAATFDGVTTERAVVDPDLSAHTTYSHGQVATACTGAGEAAVAYTDSEVDGIEFGVGASTSFTFEKISSVDAGDLYMTTDPVYGGFGLVYYEQDSLDIGMLYIDASGSVSSSSIDTGGTVGQTPRIAFDGAGIPTVAYWDTTNLRFRSGRWNGVNWTISTLTETEPDTDADYGLDIMYTPDGVLLAAYAIGNIYEAAADLYLATSIDHGATWSRELVSDVYDVYDLRLVVNSYGDPHIVVREPSRQDLVYFYRY